MVERTANGTGRASSRCVVTIVACAAPIGMRVMASTAIPMLPGEAQTFAAMAPENGSRMRATKVPVTTVAQT